MAKNNNISRKLTELSQALDPKKLAKLAYQEWIKNTARRSGNAQRKTRLDRDTIHADYAYAQRLDQGWSTLKPEGMSKPTIEFIRKYIKKQRNKK